MFGTDKFMKFYFLKVSLIFERSVFAITICRYFDLLSQFKSWQLCILRFVSNQLYIPAFGLTICCSNALTENISLTLMSVLERFSVPP